jgi:Flavodoxin
LKALVVYESMFGNTEQIARAVAAGLEESVDVQVAEVTDAPTEPDPDVALIVAGGPTHAFSMSRANTRAAKTARRHGYESVVKAESFYVRDVDGPLLDGEIDRARAWGRQLAASITKAAT